MDLTPIYVMIGLMVAVFTFGLIIIDHKPIRVVLLTMMLASISVGVCLHNSTQDRIDTSSL